MTSVRTTPRCSPCRSRRSSGARRPACSACTTPTPTPCSGSGATDEAREWFVKAVEGDVEGETDAVERLEELDGIDLELGDDDDARGRPTAADGERRPAGALVDRYDGAIVCDLDGVVYRGPARGAARRGGAVGASASRSLYATNNASRPPGRRRRRTCATSACRRRRAVATSSQAAPGCSPTAWPRGSAVLGGRWGRCRRALQRPGCAPCRPARRPRTAGRGRAPGLRPRRHGRRTWPRPPTPCRPAPLWVATNTDGTLPTDRGVAPGNGSLVAAVAARRRPRPDLVAGKPAPPLYLLCADRPAGRAVRCSRSATASTPTSREPSPRGWTRCSCSPGSTTCRRCLEAPPQRRPTWVAPDLRALLADPDRGRPRAGGSGRRGARGVRRPRRRSHDQRGRRRLVTRVGDRASPAGRTPVAWAGRAADRAATHAGGPMAKRSIQGYVELASGLGELTRSRAKEAAAEIVALAGVRRVAQEGHKQASELADELLARRQGQPQAPRALVRREVESALASSTSTACRATCRPSRRRSRAGRRRSTTSPARRPAKSAPHPQSVAEARTGRRARAGPGRREEGSGEEGVGQEGSSEEGAGHEGHAAKKARPQKAPRPRRRPAKKAPAKKAPRQEGSRQEGAGHARRPRRRRRRPPPRRRLRRSGREAAPAKKAPAAKSTATKATATTAAPAAKKATTTRTTTAKKAPAKKAPRARRRRRRPRRRRPARRRPARHPPRRQPTTPASTPPASTTPARRRRLPPRPPPRPRLPRPRRPPPASTTPAAGA